MTTTPQAIKKTAKFLAYVLGRRPDEFGLLPDPQGFVRIKTLLQALHEDPEWRHIRQGHLTSLLVMEREAPIEIQDDCIRARNREFLPNAATPAELPKLLYTTVRQRAYPVVHGKDLRPGGATVLLLSGEISMARRLGRRVDNTPVLLTVQTALSQASGTNFKQYGELLFLADFIPAQAISGPPLPREKSVSVPSKAPDGPVQPRTPGSYFPNPDVFNQQGALPGQRRKRNEMEWKKDRRRARKEKERQWR